MGGKSGPYSAPSGHLFDEARQWASILQQKRSPIVDVLLNTAFLAQYTALRRIIQSVQGPAGSPFGKWQIQEASSPTQNFKIGGGDSSLLDVVVGSDLDSEGPARFFLGGHMCLLKGDKNWRDNVTTRPSIHSTITAISGATVTDSSAFFELDGDDLVGRPFFPDITNEDGDDSGPLGFTILSKIDENTLLLDLADPRNQDGSSASYSPVLSTLEDFGAAIGDHYRIGLTTPASGTRIDTVVLDVYEDEADSSDDPIVKRSILGTITESANALVVRQRVEVLEDLDVTASPMTFGESPLYYERRTDHDGNVHHRVALALITRSSGDDDVSVIQNLEANSNELWALSFGTLPPTTTDATITDATSVGVETAPGSYGGTTLNISRLLLQSLGNVTDAMNKAFQNMGDYVDSSDTVRAGDPGVGSVAALDSPADGRHLMLATNEEHGAFLNAAGVQESDAATANTLISKQGHIGSASPLNDSSVVGARASHCGTLGSQISFAGIRPFNSTPAFADTFVLGNCAMAVGIGFSQFEDMDSNGVQVAQGAGAIPNDSTGLYEDLGILIQNVTLPTGFQSKAAIQARYAVVPVAHFQGAKGHNSDRDFEGHVRIRDWDVYFVGGQYRIQLLVDIQIDRSEIPAANGVIYLIAK